MKIKETMYVHKSTFSDRLLLLFQENPDKYYTYLGTVEMEGEFDMPSEATIKQKKIGVLRAEIEHTRAKAQLEVERLEEKIQKLMALEVE